VLYGEISQQGKSSIAAWNVAGDSNHEMSISVMNTHIDLVMVAPP